MDRFLVKSEDVKTEHKKQRVKSYHEDDGAGVLPPFFERQSRPRKVENDMHFMDQLAAYLACQSGLVKLTDDGNKATFGKPSGDIETTSTSAQWQRVRQGGGLRVGLSCTKR